MSVRGEWEEPAAGVVRETPRAEAFCELGGPDEADAELLTAFSRGELLDRRIEDLHTREHRDRTLKYFQRFRHEPGFTYDDLKLETKDGRVVPVEVRGMNLGFDERKIILVYVCDITEERLLQCEVLFQNHKLTTLNALSSAIRNSMELHQILSGSLRVIMEASGSV